METDLLRPTFGGAYAPWQQLHHCSIETLRYMRYGWSRPVTLLLADFGMVMVVLVHGAGGQ